MLYGNPSVSDIVTVMFDPAYWQASEEATAAVNRPIESVLEVARREVTDPLFRAMAVKAMVPVSEAAVLYVNVMLPLAPETRLSGLPAVPVSDCVTVPVFTGVGGFGLAAMPFCVPVVRLVTVITSRKLEPAASAVTGLPERSVSWNVTPYERSVHPP